MELSLHSDRRPLRALRLVIVALACVVAASGCVSPLDPDTPRRRIVADDPIVPDTTARSGWFRATVYVAATDNGSAWQHHRDSAFAEVDTSGGRTAVRMRYTGTRLPPYSTGLKMLHRVMLAVDSIAADGAVLALDSDPRAGTGALFQIAKGLDSVTVAVTDTIIVHDPSIGSATVFLSRDQGKRSVTGSLMAAIQNYRIALDAAIVISW